MKKIVKPTKNLREKKRKHLKKAEKDFKKIKDEIAPFMKGGKFKKYSTEEEWCETSSLYS